MTVTKIETSAAETDQRVLAQLRTHAGGSDEKGIAAGMDKMTVTKVRPSLRRLVKSGQATVEDGLYQAVITPAGVEAAIADALNGNAAALEAIADKVDPQIGQETGSTDPAKGRRQAGKDKDGKDLPGTSPADRPQHESCSTCGYGFAKARDKAACNTKAACDKRVAENELLGITAAKRAKQGGKLTDAQKTKLAKLAAKASAA